MMEVAPPESLFTQWFQTAIRCLVKSEGTERYGKSLIKEIRYVLRRRTQVNYYRGVENDLTGVKTGFL